MRATLLRVAEINGGVIRRDLALRAVEAHVVDDAIRVGALVRLLPGVYALPHLAGERETRQRAALAYLPTSALSHLDALDRCRLLPPTCPLTTEPVRVTVATSQGEVDVPGLRVTRRRGFIPQPPYAVVRAGVRHVRVEQAIVESWPLLPREDRRAPLICAVRSRRTTAERLRAVLELQPRTAGAGQLRQLIDLVAAGCHSELELWGHHTLFAHPRLRRARSQVPMDLPTGRIYLDRYFDEEMVNVELDGAAWHAEPRQRERDLKRDAMLGRRGILVVRYSHRRLHREGRLLVPELLGILAMRRAQLGGPRAA